MSNEQRVAILLASLKESTAAVILQRLSPAVMGRVANAIRDLGVVSGDVRKRALTDCLQEIMDTRDSVTGDEQTASHLLEQAIGKQRATALLQGKKSEVSSFSGLSEMSADQILSVLGREQPSVIAMVLRYLESELAAEILNLLPRDVSKRVMVILCTGRPPSDAVVARMAAYIESRLGKSKQMEKTEAGDIVDQAATILQAVDHTLTEDILQTIDEQSPELGTELRDRLFKFDDIVRLSDVDMRRIMQEIDMDTLGISLRIAPVDVREKFFNNMSKRAAEGLKEDMQFSPKMKLSEIEIKQKEIISVIRDLDGQGEISLKDGGRNEYV